MDVKSIARLAELMSRHDLTEISVQEESGKIRLCRERQSLSPVSESVPLSAAAKRAIVAEEVKEAPVVSSVITAPMPGTFYSSPSPEAPAFVKKGDKIHPETVVCIIEAMKVMNEIKAEASGIIKQILVSNATPIEYGQPLFELVPE